MANPTLIAFADAIGTAVGNNGTVTTASLTWQTGDVLVAAAVNEGNQTGASFSAPTNTGSGLSWTSQQTHASSSDTGISLWTAVASAGSSGTITGTYTVSAGTSHVAFGVYQFRAPAGATIAVGHTVMATGKTTSPQTGSITMTSADSAVVWAAGDWSAAAAESPAPAATTHSAASPGPVASPVATPTGTFYTFYFDDLDDQAATGAQTFGYSGSSAGPFAIVVCEVTISGGAAAVPPPVYLPRNTTGRGVRSPVVMRRYARTPPLLATGVTFTDAVTGALIFGGTVEEDWTWAFPRQSHLRRLPIARGLRDRVGMRGYARTPSALRYTYTDTAAGAWVFASSQVETKRGTDAGSGAWIFAGSRVEAKRGTDARSGTLIFAGSRTEAATFVQARSGALIFGGARTELKRGTDAQTGSVIFGGSRTELKRYDDVRAGTVTFGGSATQLRIGTDARTGTIIFGGHSSTAVTTVARAKVTFIIPDARGRRRRTHW